MGVILKNNTQEIILEKDGIDKTIYTLKNANKNNFCNYIVDNNYVIIYHDRKDQEGYHYQDVRFVYDTENFEELKLSQGTYFKLNNMYITKRQFSINTVMSYMLNLAIFDPKVSSFHDYMSSSNPLITKDEIKREILKQYPVIEKYLNPMIYIFNKRKLERELRSNYFQLHSLKQDIKNLDYYEKSKKGDFDKKLIKK